MDILRIRKQYTYNYVNILIQDHVVKVTAKSLSSRNNLNAAKKFSIIHVFYFFIFLKEG